MAAIPPGWSWCSQTRRTLQPLFRRSRRCRPSRSTVAWIFSAHQPACDFGIEKCTEQRCQKQPSMKTQSLCRRNTTSAVHRRAGSGRASLRNRVPTECRAARRHTSGRVSLLGFAIITRRTAGEEADGARDLIERPVMAREPARRRRPEAPPPRREVRRPAFARWRIAAHRYGRQVCFLLY